MMRRAISCTSRLSDILRFVPYTAPPFQVGGFPRGGPDFQFGADFASFV